MSDVDMRAATVPQLMACMNAQFVRQSVDSTEAWCAWCGQAGEFDGQVFEHANRVLMYHAAPTFQVLDLVVDEV
jgi:hypothetical protein